MYKWIRSATTYLFWAIIELYGDLTTKLLVCQLPTTNHIIRKTPDKKKKGEEEKEKYSHQCFTPHVQWISDPNTYHSIYKHYLDWRMLKSKIMDCMHIPQIMLPEGDNTETSQPYSSHLAALLVFCVRRK